MKSTALIIATLVAAGWAPIAAAQEASQRTVVAASQERGYMGVQIAFEDGALIVSGVLPGTPAEEAGLQAGDRILGIGDLATKSQEKVEAFLAGLTVGQVLALHVERGDQHANMQIRLVSLAAVQPGLVEVPVPTRRVVRAAPPVAVERITAVERPVPVTVLRSSGSDAAEDRLQSSRVQAITKLRADARLRAMDQRTQAERERGRRIDELRLRSAASVDDTEERADAQRRAEARERADARKVRADARREATAARKRAEDREAVTGERKEREDVVDGSAGDQRLDELKQELKNLRAELDRLRAQIRKLSRETDK